MPPPSTTISSQSKRKLKAFQFHPEDHQPTDKENTDNSHHVRDVQSAEEQEEKQEKRTDQPEGVTLPQTPNGRIPLSDLIANPEDALSLPISATPVEQVEWKTGPGSSQPPCSARSFQRRRKRARSSSPTSETHASRSKTVATNNNALNLEAIGRSLKTPKQDDPVSLLWANYVGARGLDDSIDLGLPPLAPLSSSPNTPATAKKDNLRRTASCGIEWPTSSTKKRKLNTHDQYSRAKGIFAVKKDSILAKSIPNQSRVSILVDSIQQSLLHKTASDGDGPSSSSPLPEGNYVLQPSPSKESIQLHTILEQQENPFECDQQDRPNDLEHMSSDFDDMDLDPDDPELINALNAASQQPTERDLINYVDTESSTTVYTNLSTTTGQKDTPKFVDPQSQLKRMQRVEYKSSTSLPPTADKLVAEEFDTFDDDNDDEFATELAELVDRVNTQEVTSMDGANDSVYLPKKHKAPDILVIDDFDDIFDDVNGNENDIWAAADQESMLHLQGGLVPVKEVMHDHRTIKRYLVQESLESQFIDIQNRVRPEKILSIKDEKLQQLYTVHLRQSWYESRCLKNSYVHLIGDFDCHGRCIVDDKTNMVVVHPDHLISATTVADSFSCERRATLQDRVKATAPAEPPQVYGHLIHEIFGEALRQNRWDSTSLRQIVQNLIPAYLESLYEINVQVQDAVEYVMGKMPELTGWASIFVTGNLDLEATIRDRNDAVVPMAIDKLLELEEHVWSPMYGLKGNIDATVQVQMQLPGEGKARILTVPFELKTGKRDSNAMHRAQTALYTLLMSDRYDINVTSGILYYLETSKTFRVEGIRGEIRDMIIQRNKLAGYVHDKLALPPMVKREQLCKKCYAQNPCFIYHKLMENGDGNTSGLKDIFASAVGHLNEPHRAFFRKWDDLLTKEERDAMKFKRELWTMLSIEREALGRCFSNVIIEPGSAVENPEAPKINRYSYSFTKQQPKQGFSFAESQITVGEPIVISDEKGHFALANGFVTQIRPSRITVAVDRRLQNARNRQPGFDTNNNQVFSAIMDVKYDGTTIVADSMDSDHQIRYRIDKDEFQNGMAVARNNIIKIMEKDLWRARELRQLIVDLKSPSFKQTATGYTLSGPASQQQINNDQRNAIQKVMNAKDYALVLGMPGTGKTTTIAHIIRALVLQGKSILLTSYTHTAVDNILLKIKDDDIPILRLGAKGKVHPEVANFVDLACVPKGSLAELETSWIKSKVVATTCLGINHAIFNHRKFDYCIVDEASQITLPVCLGPIRLASTFILVGDHYQLPPLVQNKEAQEGGLDISLFKLLSDAQPSAVVNLEHQYRMAEDIMLLSNGLIYDGRLKCGTSSVALRMLTIPSISVGLEAHHYTVNRAIPRSQLSQSCILGSTSCWLARSLDPSRRTVFLNTDPISGTPALGAPETVSGHGTRITNQTEAILVAQLLTTLIRSGVSPKSIGVITFYRSQLALLKVTSKLLAGTSAAGDVEMHTADKYQGRDKEVILLSYVRSNDSSHVGELLKDWRRVNVALTRARSKLVIVGSLSTLGGSGIPVLSGMSKILLSKGWVLDLPPHVLDLHHFEGVATQTQQQQQKHSADSHDDRQHLNRLPTNTTSQQRPSQQIESQRRPLSTITNSNGSNKVKPVSKKPTKVINGGGMIGGYDKFLNQHPVLRNVVDEGDYNDDDDGNEYDEIIGNYNAVGDENAVPLV